MVISVTETSGNKVKKSSCPAYVYKEAIAKIMKEMEEILGKSDGLEIKPSENAIDEPWTYPFVDDEKETTIKSNLTGLFDNNSPSRRECNLWLYENGDINKDDHDQETRLRNFLEGIDNEPETSHNLYGYVDITWKQLQYDLHTTNILSI